MENKNCGFKRGERVSVIGVSGYGTVVRDQESKSVEVKWDDSKDISHPLGVNLVRVGWTDFPPKVEIHGSEAVKLIAEKRDELVKQRNSLNSRIIELEDAIKVLEG